MLSVARLSRRRVLALAAFLAAQGSGRDAAWGAAPAAAAPAMQVTTDDGRAYDAYIPAALKADQFAQYTCEFDAAWVILKTFSRDVSLEEQVAIIGVDQRVEPHIDEARADRTVIHGGDITSAYSGDYTQSYLARTTGQAMRKVFEHYAFAVEPVGTRTAIETALQAGAPVWMKSTVDFQPWEPVTWVTPEGEELPGVLGNDHAVVAIGYNDAVVVIRDVLGPTSTNWNRAYEYEVPWETFLAVWEAQGFDGLAVQPPDGAAPL